MVTVSAQLYSYRTMVGDNLHQTLQQLADLGLRSVEPYAFQTRTAEYKQALTAAGLTAPSGHAAIIEDQDPERIFDAAAELGLETLIDPWIPAENWRTPDDVNRIADRLNTLSAQSAEYGFQIGYHNHDWEVATRINGQSALSYLASKLDDAVVLEVDTYWATVGGADTPDLLRQLGDRVRLIHVKDGSRDGDLERQVPAGQGEIDIPGILRAAPDAIRVIEFDQYNGDLIEATRASLLWLEQHDPSQAS